MTTNTDTGFLMAKKNIRITGRSNKASPLTK